MHACTACIAPWCHRPMHVDTAWALSFWFCIGYTFISSYFGFTYVSKRDQASKSSQFLREKNKEKIEKYQISPLKFSHFFLKHFWRFFLNIFSKNHPQYTFGKGFGKLKVCFIKMCELRILWKYCILFIYWLRNWTTPT
jgi:hypothetical protein